MPTNYNPVFAFPVSTKLQGVISHIIKILNKQQFIQKVNTH